MQSGSEDKMKISCPLSQLCNLTKSQIKCRYCGSDCYCEGAPHTGRAILLRQKSADREAAGSDSNQHDGVTAGF